MWPVDLYLVSDNGFDSFGVYGDAIAVYESLSLAEQAIAHAFATVLLGFVVLGVLRQYGSETVETSRRSPIISLCIGVPSTLVLGGLWYTGMLLSTTDIGVFFAIPLVVVGITLLPVWTALGFAGIGGFVASRLGTNRKPLWLLLGGIISGLAAFVSPFGLAVVLLAASLGVGAGVRVLFSGGGLRQTNERVVPPANKV